MEHGVGRARVLVAGRDRIVGGCQDARDVVALEGFVVEEALARASSWGR
jgi:hypothetical protein